jgi:N-acyl-D-amino-acid deacylase
MTDRGTVEPGALGDLNLIDYDALSLGGPYVQADLPAGGSRLLQKASGYVATIKKGAVTFEGRGGDRGASRAVALRGSRRDAGKLPSP